MPNFETLFSTHRRELLCHLTRIVRCGEVAQELVQESYIALVRETRREPVSTAKTTLQFNVENLLDHRYYTATSNSTTFINPGLPRTFLGSIKVEF